MTNYQIPPDMKEKEKIIGGLLTLNQFFWLLSGLVLGGIIFMALFKPIGGIPSLVLAGVFSLTGTPFAFYKKKGLTLYEYLKLNKKFKKKKKLLTNNRKDVIS